MTMEAIVANDILVMLGALQHVQAARCKLLVDSYLGTPVDILR